MIVLIIIQMSANVMITRLIAPMIKTPVFNWQQQRNFSTVGIPMMVDPTNLKTISEK